MSGRYAIEQGLASLFAALLALGVSGCGDAKSPPRIGFGSEEIEAHRVRGDNEIRVGSLATGPTGPYAVVELEIEIGPSGNVERARVADNGNRHDANPALALQAVRSWRFRPFEFEKVPVVAVGSVEIVYKGPEAWIDRDAPFPPVDRDRFSITLERTGCLGSCPHYWVQISGDRTVSFETQDHIERDTSRLSPVGVLVPGKRVSRISRSDLDRLVELFRSAHFFGLRDRYQSSITDHSYYTLTFRTGGRSKTVVDYVGHHVGMPPIVTRLEEEVDKAAGTARWIRGDGETVAALTSEGFDFSSQAAARMLFWAVANGDERFVFDLMDRVPLGLPFTEESGQPNALGIALIEQSLRFERTAIFAELDRRGWLRRLPKSRLDRLFADSAGGCDPYAAASMVVTGANPASRGEDGKTALMNAVHGFGGCYELSPARRRALVSILIHLGVPVGAVDTEGDSALHFVENFGIVRILVTAGARIDQPNRKGTTPLLAAGDDRVALTLLRLGANPRGKNADGETLRDIAKKFQMPGTLDWLDRHHVP